MDHTRHIILAVSDSLRYDSVWGSSDPQLPALRSQATTFHQAYSAGCWTLPSTASIFTGRLPHEHGATTRSRGIEQEVPTLAEKFKSRGYKTIQLTANPVTTHIFGLDRGFDRVERVWRTLAEGKLPLTNIFVLLGKRRIRDKIVRGDFITGKLTEDLQAGQSWVKSFGKYQFDRVHKILEEADKKGEKVFLFVNLMETHFPYHISHKFRVLSRGLVNKLRELLSLYHMVNQTWLSAEKDYIEPKMLRVLRNRQRIAWRWFSDDIDTFGDSLINEYPDSLFVFTSDHGDNFGDEGWKYHFSNVTEAGNRVPLFIAGPGIPGDTEINDPLSIQFLHQFLLRAAENPEALDFLTGEDLRPPIIESFWYNKQGQTLEKYQNDQFAFLHDGKRYARNGGGWEAFEIGSYDSAGLDSIPYDANPVYDLPMDDHIREQLSRMYEGFEDFSNRLN